ncbi:MAG: hypothetical protein GVY06_12000 [Alphaproteobacteria bacterium]|jgi:hypothetical protein|nr:hypothetical protein [Alphaproteobacteria bacterium]
MSEPALSGRVYAEPGPERVKRVLLATLLCGFAACVLVTLIGLVTVFALNFVTQVLFDPSAPIGVTATGQPDFIQGLAIAGFASAFNWLFGYLTIPAAMIALGFSVARFPRRRILATQAYLRWAAIWGAILVAAPSVFGAFAVAGPSGSVSVATVLGALTGASAIGALAGLACAGLFLLIVRPGSQIGTVDASVF